MSVEDAPPRSRTGRNVAGVLAVLAILAFGVYIAYRVTTPDQAQVRGAADSVAYELERTPVNGVGPNFFDIEQALSVGARDDNGRSYASELRVRSAGTDSRGDLYEITNSHGDHPVCLAVTVETDPSSDAPVFPSVEVSDGRC